MAETITNLATGLEQVINEAVQNAIATQSIGGKTAAGTQNTVNNVGGQKAAAPIVPAPTGTATPTDVSEFNAPLAKVGNMQTGEYVNPYQAQQQDLVEQLGGAKTYETPVETQNLLKGIFASQSEKFDYVAENDPLVKAARANVEKAVMDMTNKRGFAFGSGTQDMINQEMAKVAPQFEDIARGEHADFLNRQLNLANVIMQWEQMQFDRSKDQIQLLTTKLEFFNKLSDRDFNIFKAMLDQRNTNRSIYLEQQKWEFQKKIQEQQNALDRLENLGYVDEEASIVLGVPIGTSSKWVKQMAMEQANKLELLQKENEYNIKKQQLDADMEKELYTLKNKLDLESQLKLQAQAYQYKKDIIAIEYAKDIELKKIADAKEAAEKAASRRSSGGGSSSGSKLSNAQLDAQYSNCLKQLKAKKAAGMATNSQQAAQWLVNLAKSGIDPLVIARLQETYGIPALKVVPKVSKVNQPAVNAGYQNISQMLKEV